MIFPETGTHFSGSCSNIKKRIAPSGGSGDCTMSPILARSGTHRRPTSDDLLHLGEVALRFGAEACGQWWTIVGRGWRHEVDRLVRGTMASVPPAELVQGRAGRYVDCLSELAAIVPSIAEQAAMALTWRSQAYLEPY